MPSLLSCQLVKYVLTAALRDRLLTVMALIVVVGSAVAILLGSATVIESAQSALVFGAAGLRFAGMAGLVLFIVFYIRRAFESQDVDFLLSRPLSRVTFLCSHMAAFSLLAIAAACLVTLAVFADAPHQAGAGLALWSLSLMGEFVIMANAALFFSMVLPSATGGAMAVFGLYVLARLMGDLLGIINNHAYETGYFFLTFILQMISVIVPRLDLMAQSSWLVYGPGHDAVNACFILMQTVIYSALLGMAALIDLIRRQF